MIPTIEFPLVITTAFSPKSDVPYVALKKGELRTRETVYSIAWWICRSEFDKFIVVDATGDATLSAPLTELARACGKSLEYIAIQNDDESVARYGKGFGEGFALDSALERSAVFAESKGFFKCTGKIIVDNYLQCVEHAKTKQFYFDFPRGIPNFVDTRFYFTSKSFWEANLRDAYKKVNDPRGVFLENAYYESIRKVAEIPYNPVVIRLRGLSGTSSETFEISSIMYRAQTLWRKLYWKFTGFVSRFTVSTKK
jgi:hypothetical protein